MIYIYDMHIVLKILKGMMKMAEYDAKNMKISNIKTVICVDCENKTLRRKVEKEIVERQIESDKVQLKHTQDKNVLEILVLETSKLQGTQRQIQEILDTVRAEEKAKLVTIDNEKETGKGNALIKAMDDYINKLKNKLNYR